MITLISRILSVAGNYKHRIQIAFIFAFLKSMFSKLPIMFAFIILSAFYYQTIHEKLCLIIEIGMILCVLLQSLCQTIADRLQGDSGYRIFSDMRMELGQHLRKMPMGYFTEGNIGKISSVLSTDMVFIEENCLNVIANMMSYIFAQAIMIIILFFLHVYLAITALLMIFIIYLIGRNMANDAMQYSNKRQAQSEQLTNAILDYTEGIGIIKTYNMLGEKSQELSQNFQKSCDINIAFEENQSPWQRRLNLAIGLGAVVILAVALYLQSVGMLSIPYLIGMMLFIFDLFGLIKALYGESTRLTVMNSCMDRIEDVINQSELSDTGQKTIPQTPSQIEIAFHDVSFAYDQKEVIKHISFELPKNQMYALVGPSGSGKSTIAHLLTRFWDIQKGEIEIRGQNIKDVPLANLMEHISMVFQNVYLFNDTVYHNISIGRPDAPMEDVIEAAKKARCYEFIMNLPNGFDTVIGEGGATLSGGEKQRISIARCILKDAPIIILDEATASVDADNESYIQEAINELCQGKTLLVIAHRLNTIRHADQILVIENGQIVQKGTHAELYNQKGLYKKFVDTREKAHLHLHTKTL